MGGWRIILVDGNNQLRNGGITMYRSPDDAEEEAWRRAEQHDALVSNSRDKIINVVCSKNPLTDKHQQTFGHFTKDVCFPKEGDIS